MKIPFLRVSPLTAVVLVLSVGSFPADSEPLSPALVTRLAEPLRTGNPGLRALARHSDAAQSAAASVRIWADPTLKAGGAAMGSRGPMATQDGDIVLGLSQDLPWMGKETARRSVAREEARSAQVMEEARWIELRRDLSTALANAALSDRLLGLAKDEAAWLRRMEEEAASRHASGTGEAVALLRIANERSRAALSVTNGEGFRLDARATLERMLGRAPVEGLPTLELPPPLSEIRFAPDLVAVAMNAEPRLRRARRRTKEASVRIESARRAGRPDLALGVDSRQYSGDAGLREAMVTLSMSLPWFNRSRYRGELDRERFSAEAARLEQVDLETEVAAEVHHLVTAINSAGREQRLHRDTLLPRIRAALEIELGRWSTGRGEFRDLLDLHRMQVDAEVRLARASAEQWNAIGELLLCCGLDDLEAFVVPAPLAASAKP